MHLQPAEDGAALLLVHLDYDVENQDELRRRIQAHPETNFTRWFNPGFEALMPSRRVPTNVQSLFEWCDQRKPGMTDPCCRWRPVERALDPDRVLAIIGATVRAVASKSGERLLVSATSFGHCYRTPGRDSPSRGPICSI